MTLAEAEGVATASEFDLARIWDSRPLAAITGTSGKTTVTETVAAALTASGVHAVPAGNTGMPLVTAIDCPDVEVFVVGGVIVPARPQPAFQACGWLLVEFRSRSLGCAP